MSDLIFAQASLWVALLALLLDRLCGYPAALQRRTGHPVEWVGVVIGGLDRRLNFPDVSDARLRGIVAIWLTCAIVILVTLLLVIPLRVLPGGWVVEGVLAASLLAQKSLHDHVAAVAAGLKDSLAAGRSAVSRIVGRDPATLDEGEVSKAAIESLAENASDGIVAPLVFLLIGGLPGIAFYKAVNTADSMIGHKSEKYLAFGWASARLDDVLNWIPARATGCLFTAITILGSMQAGKAALAAMRRDAPKHGSPNAGYPEAALAGALGLKLGGPRHYQGELVDLPHMGDGRMPVRADIDRALALYRRLLDVLILLVAVMLLASELV